MKVRYIRNTIAHLPGALEINLTSEKIIYFLMAYKLFFRKFRDLYSSEQPIVFKVINENPNRCISLNSNGNIFWQIVT